MSEPENNNPLPTPKFEPNQDRPVTLDDIRAKLDQYLFLKDRHAIDVLTGAFASNYLPFTNEPTWVALTAESSGGKTELLDLFKRLQDDDTKLAYSLSDLTPQTFASGAMGGSGAETSLLYKINGKVLLFKDFTTIIQKNRDSQKEIMSQLREIFDGEFNKDFGTGKSVKWKGRVGCIICLTPPALEQMSQFGAMGERFVAYYLDQPTDEELADVLAKNHGKNTKALKEEASLMMKKYMKNLIALVETSKVNLYDVDPELVREINIVAQFCTRSRSPIAIDYRTFEPISIPSIERFPRFANQMMRIAIVIYIANGFKKLTHAQKLALFKIGFGSIPRTRKAVLDVVASYRTVSTSVVAARLGFTTQIARGYLTQLASLNVIVRIPKGGTGNEDAWKLVPKYDKMMSVYGGVKRSQEDAFDEDDVELEDTNFVTDAERASLQVERQRMQEEASIRAIMESSVPKLSWEEAKQAFLDGKKPDDVW